MLTGDLTSGIFANQGGCVLVGNTGKGSLVQSGGTVQIYQNCFTEAGLIVHRQSTGKHGELRVERERPLVARRTTGADTTRSWAWAARAQVRSPSQEEPFGPTDDNGGNVSIGADAGGFGSYSLTSGQLLVTGDALPGGETVGGSGVGSFKQIGGSNSTDGGICIGVSNSGSYTLSGGNISAGGMSIGVSATGSFTQTAGTNAVSGGFTLGSNSGGYGIYWLSSGVLTGLDGIHRQRHDRGRALRADRPGLNKTPPRWPSRPAAFTNCTAARCRWPAT